MGSFSTYTTLGGGTDVIGSKPPELEDEEGDGVPCDGDEVVGSSLGVHRLTAKPCSKMPPKSPNRKRPTVSLLPVSVCILLTPYSIMCRQRDFEFVGDQVKPLELLTLHAPGLGVYDDHFTAQGSQ